MLIGDFYYEIPQSLPQLNATSFYFAVFCFFVFSLSRPFKSIARPYILLLANFVFIYSFGVDNLKWILCLSFIGYILSYIVDKKRKSYVILLCAAIFIGVLFVFKYSNTFKGSLIMPLGLSFYSFKIVSYLTDIYMGKQEKENNLIYYLDYVMFFPTITAGPINRAKEFLLEIKSHHYFEYTDISTGFFMLATGLFEKIVVTDFIKSVVARSLGNDELTGINVLLGVILYSFEIYLDFDSYSNMAIGVARMLGFKLQKNFNVPYLASSIKDFWNRWHISLSTWLRDYVYFPLGGNRKGRIRQYFNILAVFFVSSLWHGLTINYLIWGMGHGLIRIVEEFTEKQFKKITFNPIVKFLFKACFIGINFAIVTILWLFFKYQNISEAFGVINRILAGGKLNIEMLGLTLNETRWLTLLIIAVVIVDILRYFFDIFEFMGKRAFFFRWPVYILMIIIFLVFGVYGGGAFEAGDFIYRWF